jgi:hypothetical protein
MDRMMDPDVSGDQAELEEIRSAAADDSVSTAELERQVEGQVRGFEEGLRHKHPVVWWVTLVVPAVMLVGALFVIWWLKGWLVTTKLLAAAGTTFFVFGRFVILLGGRGELNETFSFLSPFQLFCMVSYMDAAAALLVAFHVGVLFRLPWFGKRALSLVEDARFVLDRLPWMRKAAFTGLTLFIAFPLAATGAIGGSILGSLLGLSRSRVFLATLVGCLLGNGGLYLIARGIVGAGIDTEHPVYRFGGIAVILAVILFMEYRYRKGKQRYHETHEHPPDG